MLTVIPDAPRVHQQGFPSHFSWEFLPAKFFDSPPVPIKASQSVFNLTSNHNNNNVIKPSSSAFEIISRAESNEELAIGTSNDRIIEEESKDVNNNSARSLRSADMNDFYEDNEKDQDTETLVSEQKFIHQQEHQKEMSNEFNDSDNVSNVL